MKEACFLPHHPPVGGLGAGVGRARAQQAVRSAVLRQEVMSALGWLHPSIFTRWGFFAYPNSGKHCPSMGTSIPWGVTLSSTMGYGSDSCEDRLTSSPAKTPHFHFALSIQIM